MFHACRVVYFLKICMFAGLCPCLVWGVVNYFGMCFLDGPCKILRLESWRPVCSVYTVFIQIFRSEGGTSFSWKGIKRLANNSSKILSYLREEQPKNHRNKHVTRHGHTDTNNFQKVLDTTCGN